MSYKIWQEPANITGFKKSKTGIKLSVDLLDNISPESWAHLSTLTDQDGWFTFNVHQIEAEDIIDLPELKKTEKKSKSQQLRETLFGLWSREKSEKDFKDYYGAMIDKLIEHYSKKGY